MADRAGRNSLGRLGLALFVGVAILPIGFSLLYALAYSIGLVGLLSEGVTGAYWARLFREGEVWASFGVSVYVALTVVVVSVLGALVLALVLREPLRRGGLSYLIYLPLALPGTVAAFLVFQWFSGAGLLSRILFHLGLIDGIAQAPDLVHDALSLGVVMAHVGLAVPFFVLLFVQLYDSEQVDDLNRLARTLGASRWACLYRVTVPLLLQRAFTNVVLLFIFVLGSYEIPLLLARQSPQMVSVLTMRKYAMFDISQKPEAFIIALLYTTLVLALLVFVFRRGRVAP